jgi:short-subunit dehydrogenase
MGRSAAIQLAQKGANVVIVSRSPPKLEAALELIKVQNSVGIFTTIVILTTCRLPLRTPPNNDFIISVRT